MSKAQCPNCGDIIESKHTHDWVCCKCYYKSEAEQGIFIDGGGDYTRCGGKHVMGIIWLDEEEE